VLFQYSRVPLQSLQENNEYRERVLRLEADQRKCLLICKGMRRNTLQAH